MNSISLKKISLLVAGLIGSSMVYASSDSPPISIPTVLTVPHGGQMVILPLNAPGIIPGAYYSISCHIMNPNVSKEIYPTVVQLGAAYADPSKITVNQKPLLLSQAKLTLSDNTYLAESVMSGYDESGLTFMNFDDTYDITVQQCVATPEG